MAIGSPPTAIITLHVNGLNSPINRHRAAGWPTKQNPATGRLQRRASATGTDRLGAAGRETTGQANGTQRKAGLAVLTPTQQTSGQRR